MDEPIRDPDETQVVHRERAVRQEAMVKTLKKVFSALEEKGYDPVRQMVYYLISGEPAYITAHQNARTLIQTLERDEVMEQIFRFYIQHSGHFDQNEAAS